MKKQPASVHYSVQLLDLNAHLFQVTLDVLHPDPSGQVLSLPVWIPGSYMVREFARHIVQIEASSRGKKLSLKKLDKTTWQAAPCASSLQVTYQVYAWDLSVRAAHLDQTHGFFNGTSLFLQVHGQQRQAHTVDLVPPQDPRAQTWRVATAMQTYGAKTYGFGRYIANDYDELVDHPVEMGEFDLVSFKAHGVPHDFVLTGRVPNVDMARIARDLQTICEAQIAFFEPRTKQAPMSRYVFMTMAVGDGYGGLEHRASTALVCSRQDLPVKHQTTTSEGYRNFLALCSHEYFHTWNVKRIKPAVFADYDLSQENYTRLLWLFEGFTSYYDDLFLRRCDLIDENAYLKLISKTINQVQRGSGRKKQSVADSSFDAWTKYYRQDENSPNAIVSYYTKGSLVALALDLLLRRETQGKKSLDDIMRALWRRFGRDFYSPSTSSKERGLGEQEFAKIVHEVTGVTINAFLNKYVEGVEDLPLADLYRDFGVQVETPKSTKKPSFNVKLIKSGADCKLAHVYEAGAAHRAGLSAGDVLVAINGLRVGAQDVDATMNAMLSAYKVGEVVQVHAFRRDELMLFEVKLQADDVPALSLSLSSLSTKTKSTISTSLKRPSQVSK